MYKKDNKYNQSGGNRSKKNSSEKREFDKRRSNYSNGQRDLNDARSKRHNESDAKGKTEARNDTSWYGGQSEIMAQAAQLSFGNALGMEPNLVPNYTGQTFKGRCTVPGIMCFNVLPVVGECVDWTSPANLAARTIYTWVRHVNSGHANYDASDLGLYIIAMDQLYSYLGWMIRLYGSMQTILTRNRYLPKLVIQAEGGDYDDLADNLADFLFYINLFAARLNTMAVPNKFNMFKRHMWLFSNVYADADTDKCQMYVLRPAAFGKYNPVYNDKGPAIEWKALDINSPMYPTKGMTMDKIKTLGDELLNAVLNNEDMNIISGDILKAYGDDRFAVAGISSDYKLIPIFEPEFLLQIHNAMHVDEAVSNFPAITQDNEEGSSTLGCIKFQPSFQVKYDTTMMNPMHERYRSDISALCFNNLIDLTTNVANANLIAIATRFKFSPVIEPTVRKDPIGYQPAVKVTLHNFASELLIGGYMMHLATGADGNRTPRMYTLYPNGGGTSIEDPTGYNVGQTFESRPIMIDARDRKSVV